MARLDTGLGAITDALVPLEDMTELQRAAFQVAHKRRHRHVGPVCAADFEDALDRLIALAR